MTHGICARLLCEPRNGKVTAREAVEEAFKVVRQPLVERLRVGNEVGEGGGREVEDGEDGY